MVLRVGIFVQKRILLLGGTGQLGKSMLRLLQGHDHWQLWFPSRSDIDLENAQGLDAAICHFKPDVIVNLAAFTDVEKAEDPSSHNRAMNEYLPGRLASLCASASCPLLHISTDYVFDGLATGPYREDDVAAPLNAYGRAKWLGEQAVRAQLARHIIIRTAWLFGGEGRHFVRSMLALGRQQACLRVVRDQVGGPTPVSALAVLLVHILEQVLQDDFCAWGTYHFSGRPYVSWFEFATEIFATLGEYGRPVPSLVAIASQDYPTRARRPLNSCLDCSKLTQTFGVETVDWRPEMRAFIKNWLIHNPE